MARNEDDLKRIFHLVSAKDQNIDSNNSATPVGKHDNPASAVITSEEEMMKALQLAGRSPISSGEYWKEDAGQIDFDTFTSAVRREMIDSPAELIELFRRLLSATRTQSLSTKNDLSPNSAEEAQLYISKQALLDVLNGGVDPMRSDEIEAIVEDFKLNGVEQQQVNGDSGDSFRCKAITDHVVETMRETIDEVRQRVSLDSDAHHSHNDEQHDEQSRGTMAQNQQYTSANGMATVDGRVVGLPSPNKPPRSEVHPVANGNGGGSADSNSESEVEHDHQDQTPQLQHVALSLSSRGFFCYDFVSVGTPTQDAVAKAQQQNDEKHEISLQHSVNNNGSNHEPNGPINMQLMSNLFRMGIAQPGIFSISITALDLPYAKTKTLMAPAPLPDVALFLLHELDNGVKRVIGFTDKLERSNDKMRRRGSIGAEGRRSSSSLANGGKPHVIDEEITYSCTLELEPGSYILLPFISDCVFKPTIIDMNDVNVKSTDDSRHSLLYVREDREQIKLTSDYERAIHTMFDMVDLDGDSLISKDEFNLFALRTSGVEIRDEEWKLALRAFATSNGHLTRVGFLQLHIAEAVDADDDNLEDLWVPLHQMGFDSRLFLANALPFRIDVQGERLITAATTNGGVNTGKVLNRRESQQSNRSAGGGEDDELMRFLVALPHKSVSTLIEKAASRLAVGEEPNGSDRPSSAGLHHRGRTEVLSEGITLKIYRDDHRGIWLVDNKSTADVVVRISVDAADNCTASFNVSSAGSIFTADGSKSYEDRGDSPDIADKLSSVTKRVFAGKCAIVVNVVSILLSKPFNAAVSVLIED